MSRRFEETWGLYFRLLSGVVKDSSGAIGEHGLDVKEFFVLDDVVNCPYPAELAERLSIPRATMTGYIKSLEAAGFVSREIDRGDMRRHRLMVTPSGQLAVQEARKILNMVFASRMERLSKLEQNSLRMLLAKLAS